MTSRGWFRISVTAWTIAVVSTVLSGCASTTRYYDELSAGVAAVQSQADVDVAKAAAALHEYCGLLVIGVETGRVFATSPKVADAIDQASIAIATFCTGPLPQDIPQALAIVGAAYRNIKVSKAHAGIPD